MFHHFPEEFDGIKDYLVRSTEFEYKQTFIRSTEFEYKQSFIASFINSVTQSGYLYQSEDTWIKKSLPPVEFTYSEAIIQEDLQALDAESLKNLPYGLDGAHYQWTDLDGEGISGILTEQAGAWFYKPNLGDAHFGPVQVVAQKPSIADLNGGQQLLDLAGDGQLDLVQFSPSLPGFHERTFEGGWSNFTAFKSLPNLDWRNPNLKFVDLTGDGHADILISEDEVFTWYPSLAEDGFGRSERVRKAFDEEKGPHLVFADGTQAIFLADMSGDGLTDIARIRNGEVCYWPNLGYGQFGAKVTMDNAPWFDTPDLFDQRRIRLADIDGSGATDIIYLHGEGIRLYFNQSGNSWSEAKHLDIFPPTDSLSSVTVTDLLGNGTACLVWSSPLPGHARRPMFYVDLMGGQKPHLMISSKNNLGAETRVHYAPSTKFYLEDKYAGNPWITKLPFPVHVVERVETFDQIGNNHFVTSYKYHHGYFDGEEREFRGFGMVEQFDTDEFNKLDQTAANVDASWHMPPVHTKTWFHTGAYIRGQEISRHLAQEYFGAPPMRKDKAAFEAWAKDNLLDDTVLPDVMLSADETREACRALKGAMLRQEVYADDGSAKEGIPYTVTEQNFTIERLQSQAENRHAVFFTHPREAISYHYERNLDDPRITHAMTLEVDPYGNVLKSLAIGYGRKHSPLPEQRDRDKQTTTLVTYTEIQVTNAIDDAAQFPDSYRTPLPAEARTYELTGFNPKNNAPRFSFAEFAQAGFALLTSATEIPYELKADPNQKQKRLIEHVRTLYRKDDLSGLLALGKVEPFALPGESYKLALTPGLLQQVYANRVTDAMLAGEGRYVHSESDNNWWIPSGRIFFSPNATDTPQELDAARLHFFLPRRFLDPFGNATTVSYDAHDLSAVKSQDALNNVVAAQLDYRVLQPKLITDPNGNRTEAAFDALGMVVATAVRGKVGENLGDLLEGFDADPPLAALQSFIADPSGQAASLLGKATTRIVYDLDRFHRSGQPPFAATLARETHFNDPGGAQTKIQISFSYSDGFGREIQKKIQAEAGDAPQRKPDIQQPTGDIRPGALIPDVSGKLVLANTSHRWVGTGRTVFNNKGKPVKQYEPFFSATHLYEEEREMTDTGVSPVLFYDPVERVVATLHPNNTYEKVVFDPWQQTTWDVNDTVAPKDNQTGDPRTDPDIAGYVEPYFATQPATWQTWHAQRIGGQFGAPATDAATRAAEKTSAEKAAQHANTPAVAHPDTLGHTFLTIADNGAAGKYETRVELDIEGNHRIVTDARGIAVMTSDFDMLGTAIHTISSDAGQRWMLNDITGKPIRAWDSRGHTFRFTYDPLHRPLARFVRGQDPANPNSEILFEVTIYGDRHPQAAEKNLAGKPFLQFDSAGTVKTDDYDFKGNPRSGTRKLARDYKQRTDWSPVATLLDVAPPATLDLAAIEQASAPLLEQNAGFTSSGEFDALNRPVEVISPDGSVTRPVFNEANLLNSVNVQLQGKGAFIPFVINIDYNAKGQRELIAYHNGATTTYDYDPLTFRLTSLRTTRPVGLNGLANQLFKTPAIVQDLQYTYDPAGNITSIRDGALSRIIHGGEIVDPHNDYTYDAVYRLIEAKGREHIGQAGNNRSQDRPELKPHYDFNDSTRIHPNDPQVMRNYTESYEYDGVGNILKWIHSANGGSWTRTHLHADDSNRLLKTSLPGNNNFATYDYDAHGNMITMPHLPLMRWDFEDQLQASMQQVVNNGGTPEITYYVYDAGGQRVRKVTENQAALGQTPTLKEERIYLGGYEVYRQHNGAGVKLERATLHVMDDKQRIALVETKTITNPNDNSPAQLIRFQFGNHLGSASLELDDQARIITYEEYTPYGSTSYQAVRSQTETPKRYCYTGKERDEETGFTYHGARYYAPWLGRWTACDPLFDRSGNSLYVYVHDDPSNRFDPDGREDSFYERHEFAIEATKQFFRVTLPGIAELEEAGVLDKPADSLTAKRAQKLGDDVALLFALGDLLGSGLGKGGKGGNGGPRTGGGLELAPATGPVPARAAARPVVVARPPAYFAENKGAEATETAPEAAKAPEPVSGNDQNSSSTPPPSKEKLYTPLYPSEPNQSLDSRATKTSNAQIDAERQQFLDKGKAVRVIKKSTELHHIASAKSTKYTPIFEKLFADAGLSLQDQANLVSIEGHGNAHGPDYHEAILARLNKAVKGTTPGSQEYKDAFKKGLGATKQDVARPGSTLNDLVTRQ